MSNVLIIGATSAIAEATARIFAARGDALMLIGRDKSRLNEIAADLRLRGSGSVDVGYLDVTDFDEHAAILEQVRQAFQTLDIVLIAHGTLPDQPECQHSIDALRHEFDTNAVGTLALITILANFLQAQRHGCLAAIGSVAGDRGRAQNYVYASAKAAVDAFLSGLRQRLHGSGVTILTIKPGFVDTPMTSAFDKGLLWAKPKDVAKGIVKAIDRKKDIVYLPGFWRFVMLAICHIPEFAFKRMSF